MATTDVEERLDRDLFNNPDIDKYELIRRLNLLVQALYAMFEQLRGDRIVNVNITYSAPEEVPDKVGKTITRVGFNQAGQTVNLKFEDGILVE